MAYAGSQAKGQIGVVAAGLHHSHSTLDPSHICDLHHSSQQCWILNLLSKARDWTWVLMDASQIHFCWVMMGTPDVFFWCVCGRRWASCLTPLPSWSWLLPQHLSWFFSLVCFLLPQHGMFLIDSMVKVMFLEKPVLCACKGCIEPGKAQKTSDLADLIVWQVGFWIGSLESLWSRHHHGCLQENPVLLAPLPILQIRKPGHYRNIHWTPRYIKGVIGKN